MTINTLLVVADHALAEAEELEAWAAKQQQEIVEKLARAAALRRIHAEAVLWEVPGRLE